VAHPDEGRARGIALEAHRHGADAFFQLKVRGRSRDELLRGQHPRGTDGGVAGELELARRGEDPHPSGAIAAGGRQEEGRLGEVHLLGDGLHLAVGQAGGLEHDRERVAPEHAIGEDVDLGELIFARGAHLRDTSRSRRPSR
jgi:hypothetical protein